MMRSRRRSPDARERVLSVLDQVVRGRDGVWSQLDDDLVLIQLPHGRRLLVSLAVPLRRAKNYRDDAEIKQWFGMVTQADVDVQASWPEVRDGLRWQLDRADLDLPPMVSSPVSVQLRRYLVDVDPDESFLRYVTRSEADQWPVSADDLAAAGREGLDRVLHSCDLHVDEGPGAELIAWFDSVSPSKASLLLAPGLRSALNDRLGWPILAIVPARDFLLMLPESYAPELMPQLGRIVERETSGSKYPLSTELFQVSDDGVRAVGAFQASDQTS